MNFRIHNLWSTFAIYNKSISFIVMDITFIEQTFGSILNINTFFFVTIYITF